MTELYCPDTRCGQAWEGQATVRCPSCNRAGITWQELQRLRTRYRLYLTEREKGVETR